MINLQFKTNSSKIGSSVPSISLNYGRNWAKRPNDGSGKDNSSRLFVKCGKKSMHCQTEILSNHGNLNWNWKENKQTNKKKSQDDFALMRCEIQPNEKFILFKIYIKRVPSSKTGVMSINPILSPFITF